MCEGPDRKPADLECCAGALSGCRTAGRQRFQCTLPGLTCTGLGEREEGGGGGRRRGRWQQAARREQSHLGRCCDVGLWAVRGLSGGSMGVRVGAGSSGRGLS